MAYKLMQTFFLRNKLNRQYDYLVITPDDLILNKKSLDVLLNEIENPSLPREPDRKDENAPWLEKDHYDVLSGVCNWGCGTPYDVNHAPIITDKVPTTVDFMFNFDKAQLLEISTRYTRSAGKVMQVMFAGFPLTFVHRDVFESVDLHPNDKEVCTDLVFADDLERKQIKQYVHLDALFLHIREIDHPFLRIDTYNFDIDEKKKRMLFLPAKP